MYILSFIVETNSNLDLYIIFVFSDLLWRRIHRVHYGQRMKHFLYFSDTNLNYLEIIFINDY